MLSGLVGDWWRPLWTHDDVTVIHVDLACDTVNEQRAWVRLDATERQRADRFRNGAARRRFLLCRSALRSILCRSFPCQNRQLVLGAAEHGKPFATVDGTCAALGFNVSHSGRHGLIALAPEGRVGVDVEERVAVRNLDVLVGAVLGPNERSEVTARSGARKLHLFLDLWTMKEALSKAHGKGLSMDVSAFEISSSMRHGSRRGAFSFPDRPDVVWRLHNIGTEQFAAAVAHTRGAGDGD